VGFYKKTSLKYRKNKIDMVPSKYAYRMMAVSSSVLKQVCAIQELPFSWFRQSVALFILEHRALDFAKDI
jgi:hypothetical protein